MVALAVAGMTGVAGQAQAHSCTCRANGQAFALGQMVCIRGKLSQCQMNQNVPTWQTIADTCPEAQYSPRPAILAALSWPLSLPASSPLPASR